MNECEHLRNHLTLYLDGELQAYETRVLDLHLKGCASCRPLVESELMFLKSIRNTRPLHVAPERLRGQVHLLLDDSPVTQAAPARLKRRVQQLLYRSESNGVRLANVLLPVAAAAAIVLLPAVIWLITRQENRDGRSPSHFALVAAETHLRHSRGQLPLEVASDAPADISNWFANKVNFSVKLPNYQESSGQEKLYTLEGARLIGYEDDYAAYVSYRMGMNPISLVITSDQVAQSSGGEEIAARGLLFHYNTIQGLKVITWSDSGLTYALVSDLEERGQQSCIVCHQGTRDRDFIEPLKPR